MPVPQLRSKLAGLLVVAALLLSLGGCAALSGLRQEPKISVADVRIQDIKAMEGVFLIKLRVINPNDVPLDIHAVSCDLAMNGRHFASGIADSKESIPARGTQLVPVTVYASVLDILPSVVDLIHTAGSPAAKDKQLPYVLSGTVKVGVGSYEKDFPFQSSGELSLKGLTSSR